jgi:hypothetical protein
MLPVQPMPMDPTPQHAARCSNVLHKCASQLRYGWLCECASYLLECGTVALVWYRGSVVRCARSAQGKFWVDICKMKKGGSPNQVMYSIRPRLPMRLPLTAVGTDRLG